MYSYEVGPPIIIPPHGTVGPASFVKTKYTPVSERRPKPEDLFLSSTDRTTFSSSETRSLYNQSRYGGKIYPGVIYTGREMTSNIAEATTLVARGKLLDAIKNQNVNLAQAMAEFGQSARLFVTLAEDLYEGWRAVRKGRWLREIKQFGNNRTLEKKWIEYCFGLAPLVADLQGLCDSLADGLNNGVTLYAKASAHDSETYSREYKDPEGTGYLYHDELELCSVRLKARYRIYSSNLEKVSRYGFFNAPALAWELIPFSFVVDWAIGVGDWLTRLDALTGVDELVYIQGIKTRWSGQTGGDGGKATSELETRSRSMAQSNLPIPIPRYEPSQSLRTIVTATALLQLIQPGH